MARTSKKESDYGTVDNTAPVLRNEKVTIRFIMRQKGFVTDERNPLFGGLAETSSMTFTVPRSRDNKSFLNPLTKREIEVLEKELRLEPGTLSVYGGRNCYWNVLNSDGVNKLRLGKMDVVLDLSNPEDYIKYKIALMQTEYICPDAQTLSDSPKPTYMWVILRENAEAEMAEERADTRLECYKLYDQYKDNVNVLRTIVELIDGKRISPNTQKGQLKNLVMSMIDRDNKRFLTVVKDPYLELKALLKRGVEVGVISDSNHSGMFFVREGMMPLCSGNEEPRLSNAAKFLAMPENQDLREQLERQING